MDTCPRGTVYVPVADFDDCLFDLVFTDVLRTEVRELFLLAANYDYLIHYSTLYRPGQWFGEL